MDHSQDAQRALIRYAIVVGTLTAVGLALVWTISKPLLLIFAGILFAAFLEAITRLLGRLVSWPRGVRLAIVCTLVALLILAALSWGGTVIAMQGSELATTLETQVNHVAGWLSELGINLPSVGVGTAPKGALGGGASASSALRSVLPDVSGMFGPAWTAIAMVTGVLGDALVVVFFGLFLAAQPRTYRDAVLLLFPPHRRARLREVFDEAGETLRHWLIGQSLTMALIGIFVWIGLSLVGVEPAAVLGLQAGLLAFIPTIGPLIAGIAITLASLAYGLWAIVGAVGVYLLVQTLESYVLTPLIQKRAISVPPAFLFACQIVLGLLFGAFGLALATPLAAVGRVFLLRFYVERPPEGEEEQ